MARSRLELDYALRDILGIRYDSPHQCYYQPPESTKLKYPCIIYERVGYSSRRADDLDYLTHKRYTVTLIYKDPDSELPDKVEAFPMCFHDRHFTRDNLHHDIFTIYW